MRPRSGIRLLAVLLATVAPALSLNPAKALTQDAHRIWGLEEGLFQPTVYAISQTRDGFLWLGTQDSLIRFDGAHFREFEAQGSNVLHGSLIRALLEDEAGTLWVATIGNGIARIGAGGEFARLSGVPSSSVLCLDRGPANSVFACTDKGLIQIKDGRASVFDPRPLRATCRTADGTRWIATLAGALSPLSGQALPGVAGVTALACDGDSVWAGSGDGVVRIRNGRVDLKLTTPQGLPDNAVSSLFISADGSVWIGSDDGITRWRDSALSVYRTRDGLSHSVVLSLYLDREGTLWAGTKDGLDQFTDAKLTPYSTSEGLSSDEVGPVLQDRDGLLWIGTLDRGIDIFDGRRFRHLTVREGLASNRITALVQDGAGNIWAATGRGLNCIHSGRVAPKAWDRGKEIRALQAEGRVISIATANGTDVLENGRLRHQDNAVVRAFVPGVPAGIPATFRPVSCSLSGSGGGVWIGTLGSGLLRWRNGAVARVHVKDGLYDNRIYQLLRDNRANIWIASSKGIFSIPERELDDFADGRAHSVTSTPLTTGQLRFECRAGVQPAACRTRDGRLWFATTGGLVVVDPNRLVLNSVPPPARVTAMLVDGQRTTANPVTVLPGQKNLEIHYAGLSFVLPEKVTFRYLLDGYDKAWTDAGSRREAFYTNLPPGRFRFRIMARNADGVWGREAAALAFTVEPRLYQRLWFWPGVAALLALFIFAGYRRRVRRMRETFSLLLSERTRIARELHDTLLQGIAGVTMQLQALWTSMPDGSHKQVLGDIVQDAGRCTTEARHSLWGLRASSAGIALSDRLAKTCREALAGASIRLQLSTDRTAQAPPETEYNLLRIAQQALANVARHAGAETVHVRLRSDGEWLRLDIEDDGRGFSTATNYSQLGHFGLTGMRERAADIGAELSITSTESGTAVCVRVSATPSPKPDKESTYEPTHSNPVR